MGFAHPDHLLAQLTSRQIAEWMAYASIESIGADREDMRFAELMTLIFNRHRGKHESSRKVNDYLKPMRNIAPEQQTPEEQWQALQMVLKKGP